ncbi:MAG: hypothetical protein VB118_04705 [Oscillospiraceae bacterium]|nr:hypothetical protein [Oscillospiraceae bacterium]
MSMNSGDPYGGTPKYQSATDIYDALREMSSGEEIGILADMFSDVSWEGQDYYYTDNACKLVERWEETTDCGNNIWLMDVAAWQLSDEDANEWIYQILCNDNLAKRIGFKKLFVENVLNGWSDQYKTAAEAYEAELADLDRNDFYWNCRALETVTPSVPWDVITHRYGNLCSAVYAKLKGLRLDEEKQLIVESRAMLTGYDDFMFGLKANQALYQEQEKMYQSKVAQLQGKYEAAKQLLLSIAQKQGVVLQLPDAPLQIADSREKEREQK